MGRLIGGLDRRLTWAAPRWCRNGLANELVRGYHAGLYAESAMRITRNTVSTWLVAPAALAAAALTAGALTVSGCKPDRPSAPEAAAEARARLAAQSIATKEPPQADEPASGGLTSEQRALVVAKIGDRTITLGDVERALSEQPAFARAKYAAFDKKIEFLNSLVQFELLAGEAQQRGFDKDPEVVLAMKQAMVEAFLRSNVEHLGTDTPVTEQEARQFYENNATLFKKPETVRVSRIRLADKAEADRTLTELRAAISADPERAKATFADFARRVSKDVSSAVNNGDLGYVVRDGYVQGGTAKAPVKLPDPIVAAAFALPGPAVISEPIASDGGFDLVQATARDAKVERSFEDARRQITNALLRDKQDRAREAYIAGLRAKATVEIDEAALDKIDVGAIMTRRKAGPVALPDALGSFGEDTGKAAPAPPAARPPTSAPATAMPPAAAAPAPESKVPVAPNTIPHLAPLGARGRALLDPSAAKLPPGAVPPPVAPEVLREQLRKQGRP